MYKSVNETFAPQLPRKQTSGLPIVRQLSIAREDPFRNIFLNNKDDIDQPYSSMSRTNDRARSQIVNRNINYTKK